MIKAHVWVKIEYLEYLKQGQEVAGLYYQPEKEGYIQISVPISWIDTAEDLSSEFRSKGCIICPKV